MVKYTWATFPVNLNWISIALFKLESKNIFLNIKNLKMNTSIIKLKLSYGIKDVWWFMKSLII